MIVDHGNKGVFERLMPVRVRQQRGYGISEIDQRKQNQDSFNRFVRSAHYDKPNDCRTHRHYQIFADAKNPHAGSKAGKLRHNVAEIGDAQNNHDKKSSAQAKLFADKIGQAFARYGSHARRHFLYHDQRDRRRNERPQQGVAILGSGLGVSEDTAGVVIDIGSDEAWPKHGEKGDQPIFQYAEAGHSPGHTEVSFKYFQLHGLWMLLQMALKESCKKALKRLLEH